MRYTKKIMVAIAMLFSFNNAHAQFFKNVLKTLKDVSDVATEVSKSLNGEETTTSTTTANTVAATPKQNTTTATSNNGSPSITLNAPGFEVKLLGGNNADNMVTYDLLLINNTGKTREITILNEERATGFEDYKTFATDDQYDTYYYNEGMSITVAGKNQSIFTLSANVPSKMKITLKNVSGNATKLPYLSVAFRGMNDSNSYGQALLQMKNIPMR